MQFYLDMQFVILFASQGRYLSRNLHQVIKNIIGRAIEAVAATQIDPYRYCHIHIALFGFRKLLFSLLNVHRK